MAPQLAGAVGEYGVARDFIGRLFETSLRSTVSPVRLSQHEWSAGGCVLRIGDHDPSGAHLFIALAEDVSAFAETLMSIPVEFTRLAVVPSQIEEMGLSASTAPAAAAHQGGAHAPLINRPAVMLEPMLSNNRAFVAALVVHPHERCYRVIERCVDC